MSWGAVGAAAASAVGGYLANKGKDGGSNGDNSQTPWEGLQPYLTDAYAQAQNVYNSGGPQYFPNATYTQFSPQSQMAMQLGENRALYGSQFDPMAGNVAMQAMQGNSPFTQAGVGMLQQGGLGMGQLQSTMQGSYLNSNPYLDSMFNSAARGVNQQYQNNVMPGVNATFGSGGRTGSMAHQTGLDMANQSYQNSMTDMAANIYGNNYANERSNQLNAANSMGQMGANLASGYNSLGNSNYQQQMGGANLGMNLGYQDWDNISRLGQIGGMVEGKGQEMLNDQMGRFNYYQNLPEQRLLQYANVINGLPGGNLANTNANNQNGSAAASIFGNFIQNYAQEQWGKPTQGGAA